MTDARSSEAEKERSLRGHRSRVLEAADCAERVLALFESRIPNDDRPRKAIDAARAWARSEIRVGAARTAALSAHAAARDAAGDPAACAAARAAGHAAATAHVVTHARAVSLYAEKARAAAGRGA
jgi:hypothetical protein